MLPIKTTLLVNGISSGVTGIGLIVFSTPVAGLFGLTETTAFTGTGIFLALFATWVIVAATRKTIAPKTVQMITLMDIAWVIASLVLVVIDGQYLTLVGNLLIIAVAAWVGLMAVLQTIELRISPVYPKAS